MKWLSYAVLAIVLLSASLTFAADKVNINTADAKELTKLPGIGQTIAIRIIEYREKQDGFKKIEELQNISGIGKKKFERIKEMVILEDAEDGALQRR